jgi:hypothetical protein
MIVKKVPNPKDYGVWHRSWTIFYLSIAGARHYFFEITEFQSPVPTKDNK